MNTPFPGMDPWYERHVWPCLQFDIGAALNAVNAGSRYEISVRYDTEPPPPAFSDEDREWLREILKAQKLIV